MLPVAPGLAVRRSHDYLRHGTTSLFAALEVAAGRVVDQCHRKHPANPQHHDNDVTTNTVTPSTSMPTHTISEYLHINSVVMMKAGFCGIQRNRESQMAGRGGLFGLLLAGWWASSVEVGAMGWSGSSELTD